MSKSEQKKTQIWGVEEEDSSDSEESEQESSDPKEEKPSQSENNTSTDSFEERYEKQTKRGKSENVKRKFRISRLTEKGLTEYRELIGKLTEFKRKSNDTIELNGRPIIVILHHKIDNSLT